MSKETGNTVQSEVRQVRTGEFMSNVGPPITINPERSNLKEYLEVDDSTGDYVIPHWANFYRRLVENRAMGVINDAIRDVWNTASGVRKNFVGIHHLTD